MALEAKALEHSSCRGSCNSSKHRQQWQQSRDCYACCDDEAQLPLPPFLPPPLPLPLPPSSSLPPLPPPSIPSLPSPSLPQHPSKARHVPEPVGPLRAGDVGREQESTKEGAIWPARGAGGRVEDWGAGQHEYGQISLSGIMKHCARRRLTEGTVPLRKEERERAKVGADGGVCISGWGAEHERKRRRCPKKERMEEKGPTHRRQGIGANARHV